MRRKRLGQHFLVDPSVAERAVEYAGVKANDLVLEVGPGKGILTRALSQKGARVVAVEIDRKLAFDLQRASLAGVEVVHGDVLKIEWPPFDSTVSNLPFSLSSPFLFRLLSTKGWRVAVLMLQREFAERLVAPPHTKEYGRLSVHAKYRAQVELLERISPRSFRPPPKVEAALVRLRPLPHPPVALLDEEFFLDVVRVLFSHRRKTLRNSLKDSAPALGIPSEPLLDLLRSLPYGGERPEELDLVDLAHLANALFQEKKGLEDRDPQNPLSLEDRPGA